MSDRADILLRELVECRDLHVQSSGRSGTEIRAAKTVIAERKWKAWSAARAYLSEQPNTPQAGVVQVVGTEIPLSRVTWTDGLGNTGSYEQPGRTINDAGAGLPKGSAPVASQGNRLASASPIQQTAQPVAATDEEILGPWTVACAQKYTNGSRGALIAFARAAVSLYAAPAAPQPIPREHWRVIKASVAFVDIAETLGNAVTDSVEYRELLSALDELPDGPIKGFSP